MTHLRSPSSHNLDLRFGDLRRYARRLGRFNEHEFIEPYARPTLELFNRHSSHVVKSRRLERFRVRGTAERIERLASGYRVHFDDRFIDSPRVLLSVGTERAHIVPEWAEGIAGICHVFSDSFDLEGFLASRGPVIIGGGISAVQLALRHGGRRGGNRRPVTILSPHPVRVEQFDSDPCYIGPGCLKGYDAISSTRLRGATIRAARNPGSIPADLAAELDTAVRGGRIEYRTALVRSCRVSSQPNGAVEFSIEADGEDVVKGDAVVLATGSHATPQPGSFVSRTAEALGLPVDADGRPVATRALEWYPGLFVTGRAGELVLGPAAPNIIGAHLAIRRLVPYLKRGSLGEDDPWTPLYRSSAT